MTSAKVRAISTGLAGLPGTARVMALTPAGLAPLSGLLTRRTHRSSRTEVTVGRGTPPTAAAVLAHLAQADPEGDLELVFGNRRVGVRGLLARQGLAVLATSTAYGSVRKGRQRH